MSRARTQMTEAQAMQEAQEKNRKALHLKETALHKWASTPEGAKLKETAQKAPKRALAGAWFMEAQDLEIKRAHLREDAVISTDYPVLPQFTRMVARFGGANSNRGSIFTEWALQTPYDSIFYITRERARAVKGSSIGEDVYQTKNDLYSTERTEFSLGTGDGATTTFPIAGLQTPVRPLHVEVVSGGTKVGNDDGSNGFTTVGGILDTTASTIDYAAGTGTIEFAVAPTVGTVLTILYHYVSEDQTAYDAQRGLVRISVARKQFNATPHPLGFTFAHFADVATRTTGVIDSLYDESIRTAGEVMAEDMDYGAFRDLRMIANRNTPVVFDANPTSGGDDNDFNHAQRLSASIKTIGTSIYNQLKRGTVNNGIMGSDYYVYLQKHQRWEEDDSQPRLAGSYLAGRISGIDMYVTPDDSITVNSNEAMFTYKGAVEADVPLIYGTMAPFSMSLTYPNSQTDGTLYSVYGKLEGTTNYARIHRIDNFQA